jgi:hypothetical protein
MIGNKGEPLVLTILKNQPIIIKYLIRKPKELQALVGPIRVYDEKHYPETDPFANASYQKVIAIIA